jgi:hypothetical protein
MCCQSSPMAFSCIGLVEIGERTNILLAHLDGKARKRIFS